MNEWSDLEVLQSSCISGSGSRQQVTRFSPHWRIVLRPEAFRVINAARHVTDLEISGLGVLASAHQPCLEEAYDFVVEHVEALSTTDTRCHHRH